MSAIYQAVELQQENKKLKAELRKLTRKVKNPIQLYHHKTDGGAEYLTDAFLLCSNGHKEGIFKGAKFIVRIDGDITKDAELSICY